MKIAGLRNLCTPSRVYFVFSIVTLLLIFFQNAGNVDVYCLGPYSCNVPNTSIIFLVKLVYILFWTWMLNLICQAGVPQLAWFLVLLPFILFFIMLAVMMLSR